MSQKLKTIFHYGRKTIITFIALVLVVNLGVIQATIHAVEDPDQKKMDNEKAMEIRQKKAACLTAKGQWDEKNSKCIDAKKTAPSLNLPNTFRDKVLDPYLNIIFAGIGVVAAAGAVVAGLQYMSAREDPQKVAQAKERLLNIVIGIFLFVIMYIFLQWLVPGGAFK